MRHLEVRLRPWERRRLRQLRDHAASPRAAKRAMCLLRSAAGETAGVIARVTGLSRDAITDIRRRWRQRRLRSLSDRPRSGRRPARRSDIAENCATRCGEARCPSGTSSPSGASPDWQHTCTVAQASASAPTGCGGWRGPRASSSPAPSTRSKTNASGASTAGPNNVWSG